ncbi:MAG: hypothetical protein UR26_C0002G0134 [candidate division TM6 bacterium GW2011_GWF2_32_72]|nr:MAG: hypothetical protein UR26_C0002G0134 [candidate division TM6 bacterium GW2011_GWF2_32_72]
MKKLFLKLSLFFLCLLWILFLYKSFFNQKSAWFFYVERTMADKQDQKILTQDKFGRQVVFELFSMNLRTDEFNEKIQKLSEVYGKAFLAPIKALLKDYSFIFSNIKFYKKFNKLMVINDFKESERRSVEIKACKDLAQHFIDVETVISSDVSTWVVVAKDKETDLILGFLEFSLYKKASARSIRVEIIAFLPEVQHLGLGKLILSSIFKFLPETKRITLGVLKSNLNAIKAYNSYGFVMCEPEKEWSNIDELDSFRINLEYDVERSDSLQKDAHNKLKFVC